MVILEVRLAHNNILKFLSIPDEGYSLGASVQTFHFFIFEHT